jgi:DNA-binding Lrp family transcriptional regulator
MADLPREISEAFVRLKKEYPSGISLKRIRRGYYVYKEKGLWIKDQRRTKIISEYLGKITKEGLFVKKKLSAKDDLENAKAVVAEHGGEIIWHDKGISDIELHTGKELETTEVDLKLLTCLSMNARISMSEVGRIAGVPKQTAYSRVKALEEKLGIKYILETDMEKLGYLQYLILVKFEDKLPAYSELEAAIADDPGIQFAATIKGDFDLIMYVIAESYLKAHGNLVSLRSKAPFDRYNARWILTYFAQVYSFVPLRDIFIENVLKERVWHRSREALRFDKTNLKHREYLLLKELNGNSIANFSAIDTKYGLSTGASRYAYKELSERGVIRRPTISITEAGIKYTGAILISNIDYGKLKKNRYKLVEDEIRYGRILNKYCLFGNIGAPTNGGIGLLPIEKDGELETFAKKVETELQGSVVRDMIITKIIVGDLCYRRFDNTYSSAYQFLVRTTRLKQGEKIAYGQL